MVQTSPHRAGDKEGARRFCAAALCPACPLANKGNPLSHFSLIIDKVKKLHLMFLKRYQ